MKRILFLIVFTAFFQAKPAHAASPTEAVALLEQGHVEEAAKAIALLIEQHGERPELLVLEGNLKFHQGDYAGAVNRLQRALTLSRGNAPAEWRGLYNLADSARVATQGFVEERSREGHFIFRYARGRDALLVPYAAATLEAARREIAGRDFSIAVDTPAGQRVLGEPVLVEIYPHVDDLARVSTLTASEIENSGTIALCKFNRLMMVSPQALARGYPWLDTLAHEYTHYVITRLAGDQVPVWFHEGLAKTEERRWREAPSSNLTPLCEHLLGSALSRGQRLISFAEMSPSLGKLSAADAALAFAEVSSVIKYLQSEKGWTGVRAILEKMQHGASDSEAISSSTGTSFEEFQSRWKAWLRSRKLRIFPGLQPPQLKFARQSEGKSAKASAENDDSQNVGEESARRYARLGAILRQQSHPRAAAVEYEKAQARLIPGGSPAIAGKLARIYLELGDVNRAIAAATPAYELAPEAGGVALALGEAWLRLGMDSKAVPYFEAAIAVNPFDPAAHCSLATILKDARGERERAVCRQLSQE